jgi:hypothetical protein
VRDACLTFMAWGGGTAFSPHVRIGHDHNHNHTQSCKVCRSLAAERIMCIIRAVYWARLEGWHGQTSMYCDPHSSFRVVAQCLKASHTATYPTHPARVIPICVCLWNICEVRLGLHDTRHGLSSSADDVLERVKALMVSRSPLTALLPMKEQRSTIVPPESLERAPPPWSIIEGA